MNHRRTLDSVVKWGLVTLVLFTPLAFGTVEPWSLALMEWGITTLVLVHLLGRLGAVPQEERARAKPSGLVVPTVLFLGLCAAQMVPLPVAWLRIVSPGTAAMYSPLDPDSLDDSTRVGDVLDVRTDPVLNTSVPSRRPISVRPGETWGRLRLLALLAALFFLVASWGRPAERAVFLLITVTGVGFLVAVQGLVQYLTWNGRIYWIRKVPPSSPFGPFVNHNHFAGYVDMVIPVALSLSLYLFGQRGREGHRLTERRPLVSHWRGAAGELERFGQAGLALFAAVILLVALVFSMSRGGVLSTCVSVLILFIVIRRRVASPLLAWSVAAALVIVVLALVGWIGADVIAEKIRTARDLPREASFRSRLIVWNAVVKNLPDYLWFGAGLGTFEGSFAPHTPPGSSSIWDRAHNDYLQFLWETGVTGVAILLVGALQFARRYGWPALMSRGHPLDPLRVGIAVAMTSLAFHSLVDFNLQIGANAFLFALLGGILVGLHRVVEDDHASRPVLVQEEAGFQ